jgi:hypothetical protein
MASPGVVHACDAVQIYLGGFFIKGMKRPEMNG